MWNCHRFARAALGQPTAGAQVGRAASRLTWTTWLAGVTFVWICFWSTIVRTMPFWGKAADGTVLICAGLILAVASPLLRLLLQKLEAPLPAASPQE